MAGMRDQSTAGCGRSFPQLRPRGAGLGPAVHRPLDQEPSPRPACRASGGAAARAGAGGGGPCGARSALSPAVTCTAATRSTLAPSPHSARPGAPARTSTRDAAHRGGRGKWGRQGESVTHGSAARLRSGFQPRAPALPGRPRVRPPARLIRCPFPERRRGACTAPIQEGTAVGGGGGSG